MKNSHFEESVALTSTFLGIFLLFFLNEASGPSDKERKTDHYSLGFTEEADPLKDFLNPPARLALDCLTNYLENHKRQFARMAIENSSKDAGLYLL